MTEVKVGQVVADFTLPGSNGEQVSLSEFRGKKVVIYFYPKDMTPGCTTESCDFRDHNSQFTNSNTVVIGISPDSLKSHEKFIFKYELPFLLLADEDKKVCEMFGVWNLKKFMGKEFMGVTRSTFLIDEAGKLENEWRNLKVKGHVEEVLKSAQP